MQFRLGVLRSHIGMKMGCGPEVRDPIEVVLAQFDLDRMQIEAKQHLYSTNLVRGCYSFLAEAGLPWCKCTNSSYNAV